jgi:hypothetical protein
MLRKYTPSHLRASWRPLLGALCIALVMLGSILSAAHVHAHGDVEHPECGLCATAHMAVQVTAPAPQIVTVQVYTEVETPAPVARPQFIPQFALFSRPPPADSNRS